MAAKRRCEDNADLTLTMKQDKRDIGAINGKVFIPDKCFCRLDGFGVNEQGEQRKSV